MIRSIILSSLLLSVPLVAEAKLTIFACEPEWAALAEEIAQGQVKAFSATSAHQDPHYIQARPSLIAKVRRADLVVCSGAQLEIGWLPALLNKANNPKVKPGSDAYIETSALVQRLDIPDSIDRSKGDVHPQGNPHVQTNPHNITLIAKVLAEKMIALDAKQADVYRQGLASFMQRWTAAIQNWEQRGAVLKGKRIITHHKSWVYLQDWLGLIEVATMEPVPGIPPTAGHLAGLISKFGNGGADLILRTPYQDGKASAWLSERSGIRAIALPFTVGGTDMATDLFSLFDETINILLGEKP
jgi:zinc/manganese transport system substrate-binding protein